MADLTAANAVITLVAPGVFNTPQQLQGFAADDIFSSAAIEAGEGSMGVDGLYSVGFVFKEIPQEYTLQADSASNAFFDELYRFEQSNLLKVALSGTTLLPAISTKWNLTRGFLMSYTPIVAAGKILKPRKYEIRWNSAPPQPA
jgi:hypothetical protein